jgi:ribonuclease P protein component
VRGESKQRLEPRAGKTFPRSGRLLSHADFERVYKQGRRHFSASMTVFYWRRPEASAAHGLRVGFTVGRALGGAVQRNRIKRRMREAVRLTRVWPGAAADVVINPKKVVLTADFETVLNEVRQAFVVIEKKLGGKDDDGKDSSRSTKPQG